MSWQTVMEARKRSLRFQRSIKGEHVAVASAEREPGSGVSSDGPSSSSGSRVGASFAGAGAGDLDATSSPGASAGSGSLDAGASAGREAGSESPGAPAAGGAASASGGPAADAPRTEAAREPEGEYFIDDPFDVEDKGPGVPLSFQLGRV